MDTYVYCVLVVAFIHSFIHSSAEIISFIISFQCGTKQPARLQGRPQAVHHRPTRTTPPPPRRARAALPRCARCAGPPGARRRMPHTHAPLPCAPRPRARSAPPRYATPRTTCSPSRLVGRHHHHHYCIRCCCTTGAPVTARMNATLKKKKTRMMNRMVESAVHRCAGCPSASASAKRHHKHCRYHLPYRRRRHRGGDGDCTRCRADRMDLVLDLDPHRGIARVVLGEDQLGEDRLGEDHQRWLVAVYSMATSLFSSPSVMWPAAVTMTGFAKLKWRLLRLQWQRPG